MDESGKPAAGVAFKEVFPPTQRVAVAGHSAKDVNAGSGWILIVF